MSRGTIRKRGRASWEIKFDAGKLPNGRRDTRYITVRGKRQDAQKALTRLLGQADTGTLVEPSKTTAGVDVVEISRRMGHSSPVVTLRIYAHLFNKDGSAAAAAIEVAMRTQRQR